MVQKQRSTSMSEFEPIHDAKTRTWHVVGAGIQRFVQMTNWQYSESLRRFQHALEACGVNKMEMIWHDSPDRVGPSSMKKAGNIKCPRWELTEVLT